MGITSIRPVRTLPRSSRIRWVPPLMAVVLLAASCGSDDAEQSAGSVEPEVVCIDRDQGPDGDVAFAYVNTSDAAVAVGAAASSVTNGTDSDLALVPVVFAAGRVSPAFWVTPADPGAPVSWTVTGPDGVERTAVTSDDTPTCTPALEAVDPADTRSPVVEVIDVEPAADGSTAEVTVALVGVPETSVCGVGLEPQPVSITMSVIGWDDGEVVEVAADGPTLRFTAVPAEDPVMAVNFVSALVLDRCELDGVVQERWPSGAFHDVHLVEVCVVGPDVRAFVEGDEGSCGLPGTGGARSRPI